MPVPDALLIETGFPGCYDNLQATRDVMMVKVYSAGDISEAHIVKGMLQAQDIPAYVGGHYLQGGIGELAALDFASVYVDDKNQQDAQAIITEYENSGNSPATDNAIESSSIDLGFPLFLLVVCIVLLVLILSLM